MLTRLSTLVAVCAGVSVLLATGTASAQNQKKKQRSSGGGSIQAECARQAGATYEGEGRWRMYSPPGTAPWSIFYDCLDARTKRR
jgi:hypothetical protein